MDFIGGVKKAWDYTIGGGYADDIVNSDIFPFKRFEELAAIAPAEMTEGEKAEYTKLQPQISKSAEGFGGTLGVVTQRGVESAAGVANEVVEGGSRGFGSAIKENSTIGKVMSWISENWKLAVAGVLGVAGMLSGGFMGTIAKAGAVLLAGDGVVGKVTGKSIFEIGKNMISGVSDEKVNAPSQHVIEKTVADAPKVSEPSMEQLAKASGINYSSDHAKNHQPKAQGGFVEGLVKGAKEISGVAEGRFA